MKMYFGKLNPARNPHFAWFWAGYATALFCRFFSLFMTRKGSLILCLLSAIFCMSLPVLADNSSPKTGSPAGALILSPQPTASEISNARVFDEPLLVIGGEPGAEENKALADALAGYSYRTNLDDFSSLTGFLARFPESAWSGSLLLHLGTE